MAHCPTLISPRTAVPLLLSVFLLQTSVALAQTPDLRVPRDALKTWSEGAPSARVSESSRRIPAGETQPWNGRRATRSVSEFQKLVEDKQQLVVHTNQRFGTVRIAQGQPLSPPLRRSPEALIAWIAHNGAAFALDAPTPELRVLEWVNNDSRLGQAYLRLQQTHEGLDVIGAEITLLLSSDNRVVRVTGHYPPSFELSVAPALSSAQATKKARRFAGHRRQAYIEAPSTRLTVFAAGDRPRLAWETRLFFDRQRRVPYHARIYVDANSGQILGTVGLIWTQQMPTPAMCTGQDWQNQDVNLSCSSVQGQRFLADRATLSGARIDTMNFAGRTHQQGSPSNIVADNQGSVTSVVGVNGANVTAISYDYMREVLGRPSWNHGGNSADKGQITTVNYGRRYNNAFATTLSNNTISWNAYGNGDGQSFVELSRCLDVAGHELFHNVVAASAGLVYEFQSGALNEHFADAFGTAIDKRYEDDDDIMGESCTPSGAGIRNMAQPSLHQQPDHMSGYQTLPNTEQGDHGGVHINSGIPNRAFYSFYSAQDVPTAEQIWHRALTMGGLTARSQFLDFVNALQSSCAALHAAEPAVCDDLRTALADVGLATSIATGGQACPQNSVEMGDECVCQDGFEVNATQDACVAVQEAQCGANATAAGQFCYCNDGYVPDATDSNCVPVRERPCPANAHRVGDRCICDDGFFGDPDAPQGECAPDVGDCGPFEEYDGNGCVCQAGFAPNAQGDACEPEQVAGCAEESFIGRCVENKFLVYCDDPDPSLGAVDVLDCSENGEVCSADVDGFHDCFPAADPCGAVTEAGSCSGSMLQFCDGQGAERAPFSIDCADYNGVCQVDGTGTADCFEQVANGDGGVGGPDGGNPMNDEESGCGCSNTKEGSASWPAISLIALFALWRRRRC